MFFLLFRIGSLIIDGEIVIPDSTPSTADYLRASSTLVFNEEPIVLDGEEASFNSITVANGTLINLLSNSMNRIFACAKKGADHLHSN